MSRRPCSIYIDLSDCPFQASHMLSFPNIDPDTNRHYPHKVEQLHGHDFSVCARISGPLNSISCVVDFCLARNVLKDVVQELQYMTILAKDMKGVSITENARSRNYPFGSVTIEWETWEKRDNEIYTEGPCSLILPRPHCLLLKKVANASAEAIADYILYNFIKGLENVGAFESAYGYTVNDYSFYLKLQEAPGMFAEVSR